MAICQPARHKHNITGGFTLLEMVVALAIVAVLITSLYGTFRASTDVGRQAGEARYTDGQARLVLLQISRDLESLKKDVQDKEEADFYFWAKGQEEADQEAVAEFYSNSCLDFDSFRPCLRTNLIRYVLRREGSRQGDMTVQPGELYSLHRIEQPFAGTRAEQSPGSIELADNIEEFILSFKNEHGEMVEGWDSRAGDGIYPQKIRIDLTMNTNHGNSRTYTIAVSIGVD